MKHSYYFLFLSLLFLTACNKIKQGDKVQLNAPMIAAIKEYSDASIYLSCHEEPYDDAEQQVIAEGFKEKQIIVIEPSDIGKVREFYNDSTAIVDFTHAKGVYVKLNNLRNKDFISKKKAKTNYLSFIKLSNEFANRNLCKHDTIRVYPSETSELVYRNTSKKKKNPLEVKPGYKLRILEKSSDWWKVGIVEPSDLARMNKEGWIHASSIDTISNIGLYKIVNKDDFEIMNEDFFSDNSKHCDVLYKRGAVNERDLYYIARYLSSKDNSVFRINIYKTNKAFEYSKRLDQHSLSNAELKYLDDTFIYQYFRGHYVFYPNK